MADKVDDPYVGREVLDGKFRILKRIGAGGMGSVYLASEPAMGREVAIKILHPKLKGRADLVSRFRREARAMSQLRHPHTVRVFMYGELEDGSLYIVMEMLEGRNLNQTVRREGPMSPARAIPIVSDACHALHEAHQMGIVHRDLKPENIFVCQQPGVKDYAKLLDFGLAKVTEAQMRPGSMILTQEGMVFGTPEFMSPEQARGQVLDARSDIYSVGVILHHLLTGKTPYGESNYHALLHRIATGEPTLATDELEPYICSIILHCMQKDPNARPQTASELLKALARVEEWDQRGLALRALGQKLAAAPPVSSLEPFDSENERLSHPDSLPIAGRELRRAVLPEYAETRADRQTGLEATMATPGASAAPAPLSNPAPRRAWGSLAITALVAVAGGLSLGVYSMRQKLDLARSETVAPTGGSPTAPAVAATIGELVTQPGTTSVEPPKNVEIHVEDLPDGSTVTFANRATTGNPFRIPYSSEPAALRIEKAGYVPMETLVVPDQDRVVHARLIPLAPMTSKPLASPALPFDADPTEPVPTMGMAGRDSHYSEQFE